MQRDSGLLIDMKRAALLILQFAEQMNFEAFRSDLKTQSAVIHQFLLIGEGAKPPRSCPVAGLADAS